MSALSGEASGLPQFPEYEEVLLLRRQLWEKGYPPVPVQTGGKGSFYERWPERARRGEFATCPAENSHLSTGIECSGLRVLDIDVDNPQLVNDILGLAANNLGDLATYRSRENSPRILVPYQAATGAPPKRTMKGPYGKVEILGAGQQFVADGVHPSGARYQWGLLADSAASLPLRDALPAVTEEQISQFLAAVTPLLGSSSEDAAKSGAVAKHAANVAGDDSAVLPSQASLTAIDLLDSLDTTAVGRTRKPAKPVASKSEATAAERLSDRKLKNQIINREIWHNPVLALIARQVWRGWSEERILAQAHEWTWVPDYTIEQTLAEMKAMIEGAQRKGYAPPAGEGAPDDEKMLLRDVVIDAIMTTGVRFWHDPDGVAYCTLPLGDTRQRHRVRSRAFDLIARRIYGAAHRVTNKRTGISRPGGLSDAVMGEVLVALEALAQDGLCHEAAVRVVAYQGDIGIDLGDDTWNALHITPEGWAVAPHADVPLIRPAGFRALPCPVRDPDALNKLRRLINLPNAEHDASFMLVVAWLVAALYPSGPYCVLAVDGEQGSGKSSACRMLRRLIDPNAADLRATPRSEDDLLIAALNGLIAAFDNLSYLTRDMADALCRLATGAGLGKRKLYTDVDEILVCVCRPVLLNGIPSLLARGDLADRSIAVTLPQIADEHRRHEAAIRADFDAAAPGILALLLDALAIAMRRLPDLQLPYMPRMADFARLACAAAPAFGWTEAEMLAAIVQNREAAVAMIIEADGVAQAVHSLVTEQGEWSGTASALLELVKQRVPPDVLRERGWPKDGARLSARLKRVAPALRRAGLQVFLPSSGGRGGRIITLRPQGEGEERSERSERSHDGQCIGNKEDLLNTDADRPALPSDPTAFPRTATVESERCGTLATSTRHPLTL